MVQTPAGVLLTVEGLVDFTLCIPQTVAQTTAAIARYVSLANVIISTYVAGYQPIFLRPNQL